MTHRLQLFDTPQSVASAVTSYLVDGYNQGDNLLIVAKAQHRHDIFAAMSEADCFRDGPQGPQRLVALDADEVLARLSPHGIVDRARFQSEIGELVARLAASRPLRVYGEIVEVLAAQGEYEEALRLEHLWNELGAQHAFQLMCGYSSAHFTAPETKAALRHICEAHSHSTAAHDDVLGSYLLASA